MLLFSSGLGPDTWRGWRGKAWDTWGSYWREEEDPSAEGPLFGLRRTFYEGHTDTLQQPQLELVVVVAPEYTFPIFQLQTGRCYDTEEDKTGNGRSHRCSYQPALPRALLPTPLHHYPSALKPGKQKTHPVAAAGTCMVPKEFAQSLLASCWPSLGA